MPYPSGQIGARRPPLELIPLFGRDAGLPENAPERPGRDFPMVRHDGGPQSFAGVFGEFHVAAPVSGLRKSCGLELSLDLTKGERLHAAGTSTSIA